MRNGFIVAVVAVLMAGCARPAPGTEAASPTATGLSSSVAIATASPKADSTQPAATVEPTATAAVHPDGYATILVNALVIRSGPGTSSTPVTCQGVGADVRLDEGDVVLELPDPPAFSGGYAWHRVVAPADDGVPGVGTACDDVPFVVGWIATGPDDSWVGAVECPPTPTDLPELAAASADLLMRLACFADNELTIRAAFMPPPEGGIGFSCPGIDPAWLTCGIDQISDGSEQVQVRVPPGAQVSPGVDVEIVLRVDDPAAQECVPPAGDRYPWPETVRVFCRVQLSLVPQGVALLP